MTINNQSHLTAIPASTLLAWHSDDDFQACRSKIDNVERLYINGSVVRLTHRHHHAVQQVINYCHLETPQERANARRRLMAL